MNLRKKVSVIVPVYNSENYLRQCLDSLVYQTLNDIEIIAVNDGSTDNSAIILEEYALKFPDKIRQFNQENKGQACARNFGLQQAKGEYIGFVDSDDSVALDMFEKMYQLARSEKADLVECDFLYCRVEDKKEVVLKKYASIKEHKKNADLFIDPLVSPWNKIYRKQILEESEIRFPEGLIYEDTAFYIQLIPWIKKTAYINLEFVKHYARIDSTQTKKENPRVGEMIIIIEKIINYYQSQNYWDEYHEELEYFCVKILLCSSLGRIALLSDDKLRKQTVQKLIQVINMNFPTYRKNKYFKNGLKGLYMRMCYSFTIPIFYYFLGRSYKKI